MDAGLHGGLLALVLGAMPAFQSATVTPSTAGETAPSRINLEPGGRFAATNVTLRQLVGFDTDGFPRQTSRMLQTLLAERFKLEVRSESSDDPVYELVPARSDGQLGPGLSRSTVDCAAFVAQMIRGERPAGGPQCGFGPYPRRLVGRAVTMVDLAGYLSMLLKRTVLDRTRLAGNFDLEVEGVEVVQPGPPGPSTRPSDTTRSIVEMLPEQLGLKLVDARGPVEALVIRHAEKPPPD